VQEEGSRQRMEHRIGLQGKHRSGEKEEGLTRTSAQGYISQWVRVGENGHGA